MSALDYVVEPEVDCPDDDSNNVTFVRTTSTIGGRDAIEEFMACRMYPLASSFGFEAVTLGMTHVSKFRTLLPVFLVETVSAVNAHHILVKVETKAAKIHGSFGPKEYDALTTAKLLNGGHLNRVFQQMGLAYALHPLLGSETSQAVREKQKAKVSKKLLQKR
jgi:hypothetical protein